MQLASLPTNHIRRKYATYELFGDPKFTLHAWADFDIDGYVDDSLWVELFGERIDPSELAEVLIGKTCLDMKLITLCGDSTW